MSTTTQQSITLIRHGPPTVSLRQRVRGHQFRQFVERYDAAEIDQRAFPPLSVQQLVAGASVVFASHRPRALHTTAKLLGADELQRKGQAISLEGFAIAPLIDPRFREIEFPVDFPRHFKFSAFTWSVIALVLWRMGYSSRSESLANSRARARLAADMLERSLERPPVGSSTRSVVLVAHGGINRLIAKELRKRGWNGPRMPHSQHWGCTTYCR